MTMQILSALQWDQFLKSEPNVHLLQTGAWGELKGNFGWEPVRVTLEDCGAQVLFRKLPFGFSVAYIPKGPVGKDWMKLWPVLDRLCKSKNAIFLKVEPDAWEPLSDEAQTNLAGFRPAANSIQPRRTLIVDLKGNEEDWLARMSKKTRACFRTAEHGGVIARYSNDVETFFSLLEETGQRDEFGVHSLSYYRRAFTLFARGNEVCILLAELQGTPLAGLMAFAHGKHAWYLYAASRDEHRQLNPTYLIQLEAMRWAARQGCRDYDLYGVPDFDEETLEAQFTERHDGLWGVYGFKRKFGGRLARTIGAWERVYNPVLYRFYLAWAARRGGERG